MIFAPQDVALIAVVGFILFGPKKLPEMAKSLGSSIVEFKKAMKTVSEHPETAETAQNQAAVAPAADQTAIAAPAAAATNPQQLALPGQSADGRRV